MSPAFFTFVSSPVGPFLVAGTDRALLTTSFSCGHQQRHPDPAWKQDAAALRYALPQIEAYFAGEAVQFSLPLELTGTPFQQAVWQALAQIPYGETCSYAEIARSIGRPRAFRAVGAANGANRLPVILPCHRVIGSNRSLTGFGGGLDAKARLLELEADAISGQQRWVV